MTDQQRYPSAQSIRTHKHRDLLRLFDLYDAEEPIVLAHSLYFGGRVIRIRALFPKGHPGGARLDHLSRIVSRMFGRDVAVEFAHPATPMEPGWEPL